MTHMAYICERKDHEVFQVCSDCDCGMVIPDGHARPRHVPSLMDIIRGQPMRRREVPDYPAIEYIVGFLSKQQEKWMKDEYGLKRSRNARFNQAAGYAEQVIEHLDFLRRQNDGPIFEGDRWAELRIAAEKMLKCVHEANAYNNALSERDEFRNRKLSPDASQGSASPAPSTGRVAGRSDVESLSSADLQ